MKKLYKYFHTIIQSQQFSILKSVDTEAFSKDVCYDFKKEFSYQRYRESPKLWL